MTPRALSRPDQGFILPMVLIVIAVLSLLFTLGATAVLRTQKAAIEAADRFEDDIAAHNAMQSLTFLVAASPRAPGGYALRQGGVMASVNQLPAGTPILPADGRWQRFGGLGTVAVQDTAGLMSLDRIGEAQIVGVLLAAGLERDEARALAAAAMDYMDPDGNVRPGGAEASAYAGRGLPGPLNAQPTSPSSLLDIPAWRDAAAAGRLPPLTSLFSAQRRSRYNLNAITPAVAAVMLEAGQADIARFVASREADPVTLLVQRAQETGLSGIMQLDVFTISTSPDPILRVVSPRTGRVLERRLKVSLGGDTRPVAVRWASWRQADDDVAGDASERSGDRRAVASDPTRRFPHR